MPSHYRRITFPDAEIPQAIDGPEGEPALWLVLTERDAKKIVGALENGHAYEVVAILKNQSWWQDLSFAARKACRASAAADADSITI